MSEHDPIKRAGDVLPRIDKACPYCGSYVELEDGSRVPPDACCVPRGLTQLGWMSKWLTKPGHDPQEIARVREAANRVRRALSDVTDEDIRAALQMIAERVGPKREAYRQAATVARQVGRRRGGQNGHQRD